MLMVYIPPSQRLSLGLSKDVELSCSLPSVTNAFQISVEVDSSDVSSATSVGASSSFSWRYIGGAVIVQGENYWKPTSRF